MLEKQMLEVPKGQVRLVSLISDHKGNLYGLDHFGRVWTLVFFEGECGWTTIDMDIVGTDADFNVDKELKKHFIRNIQNQNPKKNIKNKTNKKN